MASVTSLKGFDMHDGSDAVNDLVVDGDLLNVHGGD
jgi:hypothetical protein